jgi:DNA-binding MarR family transcriptional regulator
MTIELLIHAIVRQTTLLIAQLATARGVRAPLAQVANQVFLDLVAELERQGVSRKVSADMFGLGLRTYRRKIQRLTESSTERGRSLWEAVLEHVRSKGSVTRLEVLERFARDDEAQVRAVLHDLCESSLLVSNGTGSSATFRPVSDEEIESLRQQVGSEGADELLMAIMYREGALSAKDLASRAQTDVASIEAALQRLADMGRIERTERNGVSVYETASLVIPLGASVGWEAAVFDHFKALVTTVMRRVRENRPATAIGDQLGGSTYTIDVWDGHPLAEEVYGTLGRLRASLSELRSRVQDFNAHNELPSAYTRAVIYVGQSLTQESNAESD